MSSESPASFLSVGVHLPFWEVTLSKALIIQPSLPKLLLCARQPVPQ